MDKYLRKIVVSMSNNALREKSNFYFRRSFASTDKTFFWEGRLGTMLYFHEVLTLF